MNTPPEYPDAIGSNLVETYPASASAGGGLVWDNVLEYRVWCHPERGAADCHDGSEYYYAFATYAEALDFSTNTKGAEAPLVLIRQLEYISEPQPGTYVHMLEPRITEWPDREEVPIQFRTSYLLWHRRTGWTSCAALPRASIMTVTHRA